MALTPPTTKSFAKPAIGAFGIAAAMGLTAAPAQAAQLPATAPQTSPLALSQVFDTTTYDADAQTTNWRRCGWRGCWGRRGWRGRGWRGRRGIGIGGVLAGAAVIGGIAAIASANNNRRRDRDVVVVERDRDFDRDRYDERDIQRDREIEELRRRSDEQQREIEYLRSRGLDASRLPRSQSRQNVLPPVRAPLTIDGAIDRCTEVVGIDSGVSGVDGVDRTGSGWSVRGRLADGQSFTCDIGSNGQIERLSNGAFSSYDARGGGYQEQYGEVQRSSTRPIPVRPQLSEPASFERAEGQWTDARYQSARGTLASASTRYDQPLVPLTAERMPAYPGGPVPGQ